MADNRSAPVQDNNTILQPSQAGVLGASSLVGEFLLPLLVRAGWQVAAFSRQDAGRNREVEGVCWCKLPPSASRQGTQIASWICVAPIWVLPEHFGWLEAHGARRVVALSSTSRFTKEGSSDPEEQATACRLVEAEAALQVWAASLGIEWVILRPTLIYGLGRDKNIAEIARFIRRFWFFPLFGNACGLRQPIHASDVASASLAALHESNAANKAYNLSGGETLTYKEMVVRLFKAMERTPALLSVPLLAFRMAVSCLRLLPRYRHWSAAMAERMNRDLIFDHSEAARDLGFSPRQFHPERQDLPD